VGKLLILDSRFLLMFLTCEILKKNLALEALDRALLMFFHITAWLIEISCLVGSQFFWVEISAKYCMFYPKVQKMRLYMLLFAAQFHGQSSKL
jgi:hypothetical protein